MTQEDSVEIIMERMFDAPRETVWKEWTEPERIAQWWGPGGCTTRIDEFDFRPGGTWRYVMLAPDGTEHPQKGVFRRISAPETIVTSAEFGEGTDPTQEVVLTWMFNDPGVKTKVTVRSCRYGAVLRACQMAIDADLNGVIADVRNGVGHWKRMVTRLARTLAEPQARSGTGRTERRAAATSGPKYRHDRTVTSRLG